MIYTYVSVCMYVCIYIYIYIHTCLVDSGGQAARALLLDLYKQTMNKQTNNKYNI